MKKDKEHICAYKHCLHQGELVKESEAVKIGNSYYHWDCADIKTKIQDCADTYIKIIDDPKSYPVAIRIITNLVFSSQVPIEFIQEKLNSNGEYYKDKPLKALYGLRRLFWEFEFPKEMKRAGKNNADRKIRDRKS